jgi:O-glycosyl hydrolase
MKIGKKSVLLCSALLWLQLAGGTPAAMTVTVNPLVEHQEFEGWGTSICWWGNIVGKYPNQKRDSIMDLLFDTTDGLGLSIVRYNIGGGDNPSHTHMGTGKMMEGFKTTETAQYDWTRDAEQR